MSKSLFRTFCRFASRTSVLILVAIPLILAGCPHIERLEPDLGNTGDVVAIRDPFPLADGFGATGTVHFGSVQATDVLDWSSTDIFVRVPTGLSGAVQVKVTVGDAQSNTVPFSVLTEAVRLRVVCYGDSLTHWGYADRMGGLAEADPDFVGYLPAAFINHGRSGERVTGTVTPERFSNAVEYHNIDQDLDFVILMEGSNDVPDSTGVTLEAMQAALVDLIAEVPEGVRLVLGTPPPRVDSCNDTEPPTTEEWNGWLGAYATEQGIPLADTYEGLTDRPDWDTHYFDDGDCIHPNGAGYDRMAEVFLEKLKELLF